MKRLISILPIFLLTFICHLSLLAQKEVVAIKGVLDLTNEVITDDYLKLNGEWEFYWEELYTPDELQVAVNREKSYGYIPSFWKHYPEGHPKNGYATYRLTLILSEEQLKSEYALYLDNIHSNYKLWVNGSELMHVGNVGSNAEEVDPHWIPKVVFLFQIKDTNELVLQVSSFNHRNGGVQDPIRFGKSKPMYIKWKHQMTSELFLGGSCFILGCFFIGMFFFWKNDRAALHFGFFSLFFGSRVLLVGTRSLMFTFPDLPWDFTIRFEYIGMFAMHYFMFHFIYYAFTKQTNYNYLKFLRVYTIIIISICLIPGDIFTYATIPNNFLLLFSFLYGVYIFVRALKEGVPGAIWAILAMVVFFFTTIPQILEYSNIFILDPVVMSMSYIGFMLSMSLVFAARFGTSFYNLEQLRNDEQVKNIEISKQKEKLEKQNQLINDSINYAERIQQSLLPTEDKIKNVFNNCFLYFNPQSKVSGDFYWYSTTGVANEHYFAVADCTGHGVPGAFISLIAINSLDNIVSINDSLFPANILSKLNDVIYQRLSKEEGELSVVKDGLDICLFKVNLEDKEMVFASAHHKVFVVKKDGTARVYKGDNHSIGTKFRKGFEFTEQRMVFDVGDQVYLFSDGIYDQKGGEKGKKMYLKRLTDFLLSIYSEPMPKQKELLAKFVNEWKKDREQMDDMLLFTMKF